MRVIEGKDISTLNVGIKLLSGSQVNEEHQMAYVIKWEKSAQFKLLHNYAYRTLLVNLDEEILSKS